MKELPGTLRAERVPFDTTRWSVVLACAEADGSAPDEASAARAAEALCRQYWPPLYSFVRRRGFASPDAQDLVQDFLAHFLAQRLYARADPARGRFRSFLITRLKGFLSDAGKRAASQKRGGGAVFVPLDPELDAAETHCLYELAASQALDEDRFFERQWADTLVTGALAALEAEYAEAGRAALFKELRPFLGGGRRLPDQEAVAARLQVPPATLRSHLARLRARYRETLRAEVARTVAREEDVDEELRYLCRVLMRR